MKKTESRNIQRRVERKPKKQFKNATARDKLQQLPTEETPANHRAEHLAKCEAKRKRKAERKANIGV